jgi:hypothetical protein
MPQKYTKVQFKKDLKDLTTLINQFKQDGGKKKKAAKRSTVKKDIRTFTIVEVNGVKKPNGQGRYTGQNHSGAAGKACTRACLKAKNNNITFSLRETTQGSDKVVKKFKCQRTKKKNPITVKMPGGKTITYEYDQKCAQLSK